jgi:hypothetical protein
MNLCYNRELCAVSYFSWLESPKEDLSKIVEQLQSQVEALASEMRKKNVDNGSKEDQSVVTENETQETGSRSKRWRRRLLRPWTIFP